MGLKMRQVVRPGLEGSAGGKALLASGIPLPLMTNKGRQIINAPQKITQRNKFNKLSSGLAEKAY